MTQTILRTRRAHWVILTLVALVVGSLFASGNTLVIQLAPNNSDIALPYVELLCMLSAILIALATNSRFWEWDRIGGARTRLIAAGCAIVGVGAPSVGVPVALSTVPRAIPSSWLFSNTLAICALVFVLVPLVGPLIGAGTCIGLWLGFGVVINMAPQTAGLLPVDYTTTSGHWWFSVPLAVVAVATYASVTGCVGWVHRRAIAEKT